MVAVLYEMALTALIIKSEFNFARSGSQSGCKMTASSMTLIASLRLKLGLEMSVLNLFVSSLQ